MPGWRAVLAAQHLLIGIQESLSTAIRTQRERAIQLPNARFADFPCIVAIWPIHTRSEPERSSENRRTGATISYFQKARTTNETAALTVPELHPYNREASLTDYGRQLTERFAATLPRTSELPAGQAQDGPANSISPTLVRSTNVRMNRSLVLATVLASGLATSSLLAQTAPAAAAPAAAAPAAAPQAIPAKIAIIAFEQVAGGTNEGQKLVGDLRKKYESRNAELQTRATETESLKKQLQALPANAPDENRSKMIKDIDQKDRKLQADAQELQQEEQSDFQDGFGKLMQKVGPVAVKYATDNGFTALMNTGSGQNELPTLLWWNPATDISQAVVNAYNASSGVAAQPPAGPSPTRRTTPATPHK
jgi:outer membrane protein